MYAQPILANPSQAQLTPAHPNPTKTNLPEPSTFQLFAAKPILA